MARSGGEAEETIYGGAAAVGVGVGVGVVVVVVVNIDTVFNVMIDPIQVHVSYYRQAS